MKIKLVLLLIVFTNFVSLNSKDEFKEQFGFKKAKEFKLTDTIIADINCDGFNDKAVFIKTKESGIIIEDGLTQKSVRLGFGKKFFDNINFDWVETWALVLDKKTFKNTFKANGDLKGGRNIALKCPSIYLHKYETGGGLITFKKGKYIWIHQAC